STNRSVSLAKDLSFGLPFFYRVVLPGVLLATVSAPILAQLFRLLGITTAETQTQLTAVYALIVGFVLTALDDPIYQFYEGRHGWPPPLSRALTALWRRRVDAMQRRADA